MPFQSGAGDKSDGEHEDFEDYRLDPEGLEFSDAVADNYRDDDRSQNPDGQTDFFYHDRLLKDDNSAQLQQLGYFHAAEDEIGIYFPLAEEGVGEDLPVQGEGGLDASDLEFHQGAAHSR
jgi:hypothetical protein